MIKKIMLILFCSMILFPAFISAGDKVNKLEVGEKVRINNGSWILLEKIQTLSTDQHIGYKGIFEDHIKISQYYIDKEFHFLIYDVNIEVICISAYAFKLLEVKPQFIRLEYLGTCFEFFPESKDNKLDIKSKKIRTDLIRK